MEKQLKQKYLHQNGPYQFDFEAERKQMFQKMIYLIGVTDRNQWVSTGFSCGDLIESYKLVYGLTSLQFQTIISLLSNIALCEKDISTEIKLLILKLLNRISDYQIRITENFTISNSKLLQLFIQLSTDGVRGSIKSADIGVQEIAKFTMFFSHFGQELLDEALECAIQNKELRYMVLFVPSLKSQESGLKLLKELFLDNSLWDRDISWFYIVSEVMKKFPTIDYSPYYQTTFQEIIKIFTTLIDPASEEILKKLTGADGFIDTPPILKSIAVLLVNLLLPQKSPQNGVVWSCIERLFNMITTSLDHVNPASFIGDYFTFMKTFVKAFFKRFRSQRKFFELVNEDAIVDFHGEVQKEAEFLVDVNMQNNFDSLWPQIISKILFFEDVDECKPSKILAELGMYKPRLYITITLESIQKILDREDLSMISLHGVKMTLLFLQEYIIKQNNQYLTPFIKSCKSFLTQIQKLGVTENVDTLQLILRCYLYFDQQHLQEKEVQELTENALDLIIDNLDALSIGLEGAESEQAQLYIDFADIFFPFFLKIYPLYPTLLNKFADRFLFKITNTFPEHTTAYEMLLIILSYLDRSFASKTFAFIYKELISNQPSKKKLRSQYYFLDEIPQSLNTENQNHINWYGQVMQCVFQYHPENVVKEWEKIEKVFIVLLSEWDNSTYTELALDILYNLLLCLLHQHLDPSQFSKQQNSSYETLNIKWEVMTPEVKALIDIIYQKYYVRLINFMKNRYSDFIHKDPRKITTLADFQSYITHQKDGDVIRIRKRNLMLVDHLLVSDLTKPEDLDEKKCIFKVMSIQYTVLSALMLKSPFFPGFKCEGNFFDEVKYVNLRKDGCEYLEWMLQLLSYYNILGDGQYLKLFNFFWRESHDEVFYSVPINATIEKLTPYYYPQIYRRKELMRCSFLIVNEAILCHMVRLELFLQLNPTAYNNNPHYLETTFILGFNSAFQANLHSYFPTYVDVHQYHRELMSICRYKLDLTIPQSYCSLYLASTTETQKEKYLNAIKVLLVSLRKNQNVYSLHCCLQDQFIRNTLFEMVSLFKFLSKKNQKTVIVEIYSMLLIFGFEPILLNEGESYDIQRKWRKMVYLQDDIEFQLEEVVKLKQNMDYMNVVKLFEENDEMTLRVSNYNQTLRLTRSCSQIENSQLQKQVERFVIKILKKINEQLANLDKDTVIYTLMLTLYSNYLDLSNKLFSQIIKVLFKLCQCSVNQIFNMSKTALFHVINRFNYVQRRQKDIPNTPLKRNFEEFVVYRLLGGENVNYQNIKCQKNQQFFYSTKNLVETTYSCLTSNSNSPNFQNQKVLLEYFNSENDFSALLKNCLTDPELKRTDTTNQAISLDDDFKGMTGNGHKIMHYIWDYNPEKAELFMTFAENFSNYPLNFYSRFLRKIIRLGNKQTRENLKKIALKFRSSGENQEIKIYLSISAEIMIDNYKDQYCSDFINYLTTCDNEIFDFSLYCLFTMFWKNFLLAEKIYKDIIYKFRNLKGNGRLRHLQILNTYMIAQGRFSRWAAKDAIEFLLKGIQEGTDEVAESLVTMISQCFIIAINLDTLPQWIHQSKLSLIKENKIYQINQHVGYETDDSLKRILKQIVAKTKQENNKSISKNLKIYSQIAKKILECITVYRFNDSFYEILKDLIDYVVEKAPEDDESDQAIISQLKDSEYPENIYRDLITKMIDMKESSPAVTKKKLKYIQGIAINRSFCLNHVEIPQILKVNDKNITLDFIVAVSNIARLMTKVQITKEVQHTLSLPKRKREDLHLLMAYLLAAGVREYSWKENVLRQILKHKKDKLVKEFISEWWKGKNPETEEDYILNSLVKNVENPYSYFS